jgi:DNA-binding CsgD family transcriptional regulator
MFDEPRCDLHPNGHVRRYRTVGPSGPGVYPQCVPADGAPPHLLSWERRPAARTESFASEVSVTVDAASSLLSPNELLVICAAANGLTSFETSVRLGKSVETVKTQRHQIMLKLGARNITQAVCLATEHGYIGIERGAVLRVA